MQDRPNPAELVKAVANLLQAMVLPQSTGRQAFEIRVAINALELVARQLTCADQADCAYAYRSSARELQQRLRPGFGFVWRD